MGTYLGMRVAGSATTWNLMGWRNVKLDLISEVPGHVTVCRLHAGMAGYWMQETYRLPVTYRNGTQ